MKFRKRPVVIEAMQWNGVNPLECEEFCPTVQRIPNNPTSLLIPTLEGDHTCSLGDWIIKGVNGEFYPCKPDIFEKTYEKVED